MTARIASGKVNRLVGQVAQLVEHRTENPGVGGSIPSLPTTKSRTSGMSKSGRHAERARTVLRGVDVMSPPCSPLPPSYHGVALCKLVELRGRVVQHCLVRDRVPPVDRGRPMAHCGHCHGLRNSRTQKVPHRRPAEVVWDVARDARLPARGQPRFAEAWPSLVSQASVAGPLSL